MKFIKISLLYLMCVNYIHAQTQSEMTEIAQKNYYTQKSLLDKMYNIILSKYATDSNFIYVFENYEFIWQNDCYSC